MCHRKLMDNIQPITCVGVCISQSDRGSWISTGETVFTRPPHDRRRCLSIEDIRSFQIPQLTT